MTGNNVCPQTFKLFVCTSPNGLPVDLLALLQDEVARQAQTIKDAESTLNVLDEDLGKLLKLAERLADRLAVFAPEDQTIKDFEIFAEGS